MCDNPWVAHVKEFVLSHPGVTYGRALTLAKDTYRSTLCSKAAIRQYLSTCYMVSALTLATKIPLVYAQLKDETRALLWQLEDVASLGERRDTPSECVKLPKAIHDAYGRKEPLLFSHGGNPRVFFEAILKANDVKYTFNRKKAIDVQHFRKTTMKAVKNAPNGTLRLLDLRLTDGGKRVDIVKAIQYIDAIDVPQLQGGIIRGEKGAKGAHSRHAAAFTMCEGTALVCNWGECKSRSGARFSAGMKQYELSSLVLVLGTRDTPLMRR